MKAPSLYTFDDLRHLLIGEFGKTEYKGKWIPARPVGFFSWRYRLSLAWGVFTGKLDALKWPGGQ